MAIKTVPVAARLRKDLRERESLDNEFVEAEFPGTGFRDGGLPVFSGSFFFIVFGIC
jgi:hypothetical protein